MQQVVLLAVCIHMYANTHVWWPKGGCAGPGLIVQHCVTIVTLMAFIMCSQSIRWRACWLCEMHDLDRLDGLSGRTSVRSSH